MGCWIWDKGYDEIVMMYDDAWMLIPGDTFFSLYFFIVLALVLV